MPSTTALDPPSSTAFSDSLDAYRSGLDDSTERALQAALEAVDQIADASDEAPHVDTKAALRRILETLQREALTLGEAVSEADLDAHRKGLKAQASEFGIKTERMRRASEVNIQNKEVELEAGFKEKMAESMAAVQSGDMTAILGELNENIAELSRKLENTTKRAQRAEDSTMTLREQLTKLAADADAKLETTRRGLEAAAQRAAEEHAAERDKLRAASAEALSGAEVAMEGFASEIGVLRQSLEVAQREAAQALAVREKPEDAPSRRQQRHGRSGPN